MNNDTTALQERIARALVVAMECEGTMIEVPEGDEIWCMTHDDGIENGEWCRYVAHAAAAVLPAIEEEVRAAKAEAWTDCVSEASAPRLAPRPRRPRHARPQPAREGGLTMADYAPTEARVCIDFCNAATTRKGPGGDTLTMEEADQAFDRFLVRVRRDAWDACYHQMVTAPARGVTVTKKSNPYAPERRVAP